MILLLSKLNCTAKLYAMTHFKLEAKSSHPEKIDRSNQIKSASNGKKKVLRKRGKKNGELKTDISGTEKHRILDSFISNLTLRAPSLVSQSHSDIISTQNFFKYSGDLNTGLIFNWLKRSLVAECSELVLFGCTWLHFVIFDCTAFKILVRTFSISLI